VDTHQEEETMARRLPTFNLDVTVFEGYGRGPLPPPSSAPSHAGKAQLKVYFTALVSGFLGLGNTSLLFLKMPKGSDIRANRPAGGNDVVEAPAGQGHFYLCVYVTPVAKGFVNEYDLALCLDLSIQ
jgi:hypothetical protein